MMKFQERHYEDARKIAQESCSWRITLAPKSQYFGFQLQIYAAIIYKHQGLQILSQTNPKLKAELWLLQTPFRVLKRVGNTIRQHLDYERRTLA